MSVSRGYEGGTSYAKASIRYDDVQFQHFRMRFHRGEMTSFDQYDQAVVVATKLFKSPSVVRITSNGITTEHVQIYGMYRVFFFLVPVIFMAAMCYRLVFESIDLKLSMAIFMCFLEVFQLVVFFTY